MGKKLELVGQRFGRLTVISEAGRSKNGSVLWNCVCDCSVSVPVPAGHLNAGAIKSCGCLHIDSVKQMATTHGKSMTPEYGVWSGMIERCFNLNTKAYINYGGRGITVCERWLSGFEKFFEDMGERPSKDYSVERIDNDGNYEPNNCKWATKTEQNRNHRIFKTNTTGVNGVCFLPHEGKYRAYIGINNKRIFLGRHLTIEEATIVRKQGEQKYWGKDIPCNL